MLKKLWVRKILFILTCFILLIIVFLYLAVDPAKNPLTPRCFFRYFTNFYCPACGMTRSLYHAIHGRFGLAFSFNLLWPLFVVFICFSFYLWFYFLISGKNPFNKNSFFLGSKHQFLQWIVVITIITFWILRNIPVYPFTLLAP